MFFDTYEVLVNELSGIGEPLKNDEWIRDEKRGLITNIPNVIWVIAGRENIKWGKFNHEWKDALSQHLLGNLSEHEHPDTVVAMQSLSINYSKGGRNKEALELSEKVLELRKKILGEEHPDTVDAMYNLSFDYKNSGRNKEALELFEKVLEPKKGNISQFRFT